MLNRLRQLTAFSSIDRTKRNYKRKGRTNREREFYHLVQHPRRISITPTAVTQQDQNIKTQDYISLHKVLGLILIRQEVVEAMDRS